MSDYIVKLNTGIQPLSMDSDQTLEWTLGVGNWADLRSKLPLINVHHPDFGAVGDGETDDTAAWQAAVDYAASLGGGYIISGGAHYDYYISDNVLIAHSNITIDGLGAHFGSKGANVRFIAGQPTLTWDTALHNVIIRNCRFGDVTDSDSEMMGPQLIYCMESGFENCHQRGRSNTPFKFSMCRRCWMTHCTTQYGQLQSASLAFLMWLTDQCRIEDCHAWDGPWEKGFQIKGGYQNTIRGCSIRNNKNIDGSNVVVRRQFYNRGDAPEEATTGTELGVTYTYPFAGGNWDSSDWNRASNDSVIEDCHVYDCDGVGFVHFEFNRAKQIGCSVTTIEQSGMFVTTQFGGEERYFSCSDFSVKDAGIYGVAIWGTAAQGFMKDVTLNNIHVDTCGYSGLWLEYVDGVHVNNMTIRNPGSASPGGNDEYGVWLEDYCYNVTLDKLYLHDDQATPTMRRGIACNYDTTINPTVTNCRVEWSTRSGGNIDLATVLNVEYGLAVAGHYSNNEPGDFYAITTDHDWQDTGWRCYIPNGERIWIRVEGMAFSASDQAFFELEGLFTAAAGVVANVGEREYKASTYPTTANDWDILWSLPVASNDVRVRFRGTAATTVTWIGTIKTIRMPA